MNSNALPTSPTPVRTIATPMNRRRLEPSTPPAPEWEPSDDAIDPRTAAQPAVAAKRGPAAAKTAVVTFEQTVPAVAAAPPIKRGPGRPRKHPLPGALPAEHFTSIQQSIPPASSRASHQHPTEHRADTPQSIQQTLSRAQSIDEHRADTQQSIEQTLHRASSRHSAEHPTSIRILDCTLPALKPTRPRSAYADVHDAIAALKMGQWFIVPGSDEFTPRRRRDVVHQLREHIKRGGIKLCDVLVSEHDEVIVSRGATS